MPIDILLIHLSFEKIVELLNQASIYGKDNQRVQHLRHVQELILRKHPDLLEHFLQEVLTFQTDKSIEIKKTIISFLEEAWLVAAFDLISRTVCFFFVI